MLVRISILRYIHIREMVSTIFDYDYFRFEKAKLNRITD